RERIDPEYVCHRAHRARVFRRDGDVAAVESGVAVPDTLVHRRHGPWGRRIVVACGGEIRAVIADGHPAVVHFDATQGLLDTPVSLTGLRERLVGVLDRGPIVRLDQVVTQFHGAEIT